MTNYADNYPGGRFRVAFDEAILQFEKEIKNNKKNAAAYVALAEAHIILWCYGFVSHAESVPKAEDALVKAFEITDSHGEAWTISGLIKMSHWQWDEAERNFIKGIELSPDKPNCHH